MSIIINLILLLFLPNGNELSSTNDLQKKVLDLTEKGRYYIYIDPEISLKYSEEAYHIADSIGFEKGRAHALRIISAHATFNGAFIEGGFLLAEALNIFKTQKDSLGIGNCYVSLSVNFNNLDEYDSAYFYSEEARKIFTRFEDDRREAVTWNNSGNALRGMGQNDKSQRYLENAIAINKSLQNFPSLSSNYRNIGLTYLNMGRADSAEAYFKRCIGIGYVNENTINKQASLGAYLELSRIELDRNQHQKAIVYADSSLKLSEEIQYLAQIKEGLFQKMKIYLQTEDMNALEKTLQMLEFYNKSERVATHNNLQTVLNWSHERFERKNKILEFGLKQSYNEATIKDQRQKLIFSLGILLLMVGLIVILFRYWKFQKKVNLEINDSRNKLIQQQEEISLQTDQLSRQNKDLEVSNSTKEKLISILAHDMKGPLNTVLAFSDLLTQDVDSMSKKEIKTIMAGIHDSVEKSIHFAENLFTWARSQMNQIVVMPKIFCVSDVMHEIISELESYANEKNIKLTQSVNDYTIFCDENQFRIVIRNLVFNALKFTKSGGNVTINVTNNDPYIEISVTDTGVGMDQETLDQLFTFSTQSKRGTFNEMGTGLGLIIVKEFVELNQGRIEVKSSVNKGSCFKISFLLKESKC